MALPVALAVGELYTVFEPLQLLIVQAPAAQPEGRIGRAGVYIDAV